MKQILFATGNSRKIKEASKTLQAFGISVNPIKIDIDEIQHQDSSEIAKAKARAAYEITHAPVVVSDTSWEIPALGGFPSGYMKDISLWFDAKDWLSLMSRHEDKTIYCHEHVVYFDGNELRHFVSTYEGKFTDEPRGRIDVNGSIEQVVVLYGNLTMAEHLASGNIASAGEVLGHWTQFGEWFAAQTEQGRDVLAE